MRKNQKETSLKFYLSDSKQTKRQQLGTIISKSLLGILFFLGMGGSLLQALVPPVSVIILLSIGIIGCVLFVSILEQQKRPWALLFFLIWLVVFCLLMQKDLLNGLRLTANHLGEVLGQRFGQIYPIYDVSVAEGDHEIATTIFFIPICVCFALLCSYLAYARDAFISLITLGVVIFLNVFLKIELDLVWLCLMALAQVLLFAQVHDTQTKFYGYGRSSYRKLALLATLIFCVFLVIVFSQIPVGWSNPFSNQRANLLRTVDRLRYGLDDSSSMPDGDFIDLAAFEPSNNTALEVTMEEPMSLWLRGYVGSVYTGNGWDTEDPTDLYENSDIFYWLHEDNFYGQKQLSSAALVTEKESADNIFGVHIKNIGASSRNIYAPYEIYSADEELIPRNGIEDARLKSTGFRGLREYTYYSMPNLVRRYPDLVQGLYSGNSENILSTEPFLLVESNYAQYVYEQYTEIPENVDLWMKEYMKDFFQKEGESDYSTIKQAIITYLTEETTYSTDPTRSGSDDFAYDFLLLDKTGYSVHYATAATLMFRAKGLPARYIEGYLITPQDVEGASINSIYTLDGTHAHAWVEVYQNGVGWIPVEVTPPYLGLMEEADYLEGVPEPDTSSREQQSSEQEIIEEQTEMPEVSREKQIESKNYQWFILIGIMLLFLLLMFLLYRYFRYKKWLRRRLEACLSENNNIAVIAMFRTTMEVLEILGLESEGVWLISKLTNNLQKTTGLTSESLEKVFYIYEEAAYSKYEVGLDKRREIEKFVWELNLILKERFKGLKGLRINHLLSLTSSINNFYLN